MEKVDYTALKAATLLPSRPLTHPLSLLFELFHPPRSPSARSFVEGNPRGCRRPRSYRGAIGFRFVDRLTCWTRAQSATIESFRRTARYLIRDLSFRSGWPGVGASARTNCSPRLLIIPEFGKHNRARRPDEEITNWRITKRGCFIKRSFSISIPSRSPLWMATSFVVASSSSRGRWVGTEEENWLIFQSG